MARQFPFSKGTHPQAPMYPAGVSGSGEGTPGIMGLPGAEGPPGAAGSAGATGAQGVPGLLGLPGATGAAGATGATGAAGPTGATGSTGPAGLLGLPGVSGTPGVGTAGKIPVWGSGNTLGESSMTESGGIVNFGARPTVAGAGLALLSELFTQTAADARYVMLTGTQTISGAKEFSGNMTLANAATLFGRRGSDNAQVTLLRYDTGTNDISMVLGGTNFRWRDTGSGVPMLLTSAGLLDVLSQYNIGGVALATFASSYNMLYRRDGVIGIYLGGADPSNYYDNTTHIFRDRTAANALVLSPATATFAGTVRSTSTYGWVMGDITSVGRIRYGASAASSFDFLTAANGYADVYVKDVFGTTLRGSSAVLSSLLNLTGGGGDSYLAAVTSAGSIITGSAAGDLAFRTAAKNMLFSVNSGSSWSVALKTDGSLYLGATGTSFINGRGHKMGAVIISNSAPSGVAEDGTVWWQV